MADPINPTVEIPAIDAARAPWADPTCTEYAVEELTQAGGPGVTDAGFLS